MDKTGVGKRIKEIRKTNNFSQTEFAEILEIAQGGVSEMEKGGTMPGGVLITKICQRFNIDANWLLMGIGTYARDGVGNLNKDIKKEVINVLRSMINNLETSTGNSTDLEKNE